MLIDYCLVTWLEGLLLVSLYTVCLSSSRRMELRECASVAVIIMQCLKLDRIKFDCI